MRLISVCVGLPLEVSWKGKSVTTGIFKQPVSKRVRLRSLNLDGDQQADLTVHGKEGDAEDKRLNDRSLQSPRQKP